MKQPFPSGNPFWSLLTIAPLTPVISCFDCFQAFLFTVGASSQMTAIAIIDSCTTTDWYHHHHHHHHPQKHNLCINVIIPLAALFVSVINIFTHRCRRECYHTVETARAILKFTTARVSIFGFHKFSIAKFVIQPFGSCFFTGFAPWDDGTKSP